MRALRVFIATPAPRGSRRGNRITALRWAKLLRGLGHHVSIKHEYSRQRCDVLVALHARHSHNSIVKFAQINPDSPIVLALTGTDLYGDIHHQKEAQESLQLASRLVLLQPMGINQLPKTVKNKAVTIYQSVVRPPGDHRRSSKYFDVCVVGHLRDVKDPMLTAQACQLLPAHSRIRVRHIGQPLSDKYVELAHSASKAIPRYHWLGAKPRWQALRLMAKSHLLSLTSVSEGGANVVTEAIGVGTPVVSTKIEGSVGLLGPKYPGYFPVGNADALAVLLERIERSTELYSQLSKHCNQLQHLVSPEEETRRWSSLLGSLL